MSAAPERTADAIIVGAGLAGLVAASELAAVGKHVLLLDQEPEASLGGQAFWSFGGLFFVDSPEQRHAGLKDSFDLAWNDWLSSAQFDRPEDEYPKQFARAYVQFATEEKRDWVRSLGIRVMPNPSWAERGAGAAGSHGNSVPRFHLTWGTGPAVMEPFVRKVREAAERGLIELAFRHRVDGLIVEDGQLAGVTGSLLAPSGAARGEPSSREVVGEFTARAGAVLIASGGIGHNLELIHEHWPQRLGPLPKDVVIGVPNHVDGRMLGIAERDADAQWIGRDRMWHYAEGVRNWSPVWDNHGIRILAAPSSIWLDANGKRLPAPLFPGHDTLGSVIRIGQSGHSHSWFVLNWRIVEKEFALSGSEQNPDLTGRDIKDTVKTRLLPGVPGPIQAFLDNSPDWIVRDNLMDLVAAMNELTDEPLLHYEQIEQQIVDRDREVANPVGKDLQVMAIRSARRYVPDRVSRVVAPHRILDPEAGPLIAVKLQILTRKTLGGLQTDLDGRLIDGDGRPIPGLYAAGEVAGFGGGGMHGYNALEGTFLGGCLFSGRVAGRAIAARV